MPSGSRAPILGILIEARYIVMGQMSFLIYERVSACEHFTAISFVEVM